MELDDALLTVSMPYQHFHDDVTSLLTESELEQVRFVRWTFKDGPPEGVPADAVDMVVLPFHTTAEETTEQYISTHVLSKELRAASQARLIQAPSIGIEGLVACLPAGPVLSNAVGVMEQPTAELAVTLLLASVREIPGFIATRSKWDNHRSPGLIGSRVLVLGFGGVGAHVGRMLAGFDVDVVPVASRNRELADGTIVHGIDELNDLLPTVDAVVCTLPLSEHTVGLVDAQMLALMRDGATFVNVGRGAVVNTEALYLEADRGRLIVALDVTEPEPLPPEHPMWQLPNVLITPHVGGNTDASHSFQAKLLAAQIRKLLGNETPSNIVHGHWPLQDSPLRQIPAPASTPTKEQ